MDSHFLWWPWPVIHSILPHGLCFPWDPSKGQVSSLDWRKPCRRTVCVAISDYCPPSGPRVIPFYCCWAFRDTYWAPAAAQTHFPRTAFWLLFLTLVPEIRQFLCWLLLWHIHIACQCTALEIFSVIPDPQDILRIPFFKRSMRRSVVNAGTVLVLVSSVYVCPSRWSAPTYFRWSGVGKLWSKRETVEFISMLWIFRSPCCEE